MRIVFRFACAVCLALEFLPVVRAQSPDPQPTFEAASIKPANASEERNGNIAGGRFTMTSATLRDLVAFAYPRSDGRPRRESEIVGAPSWSNTDRFDVVASAAGALAGVDASNTAAGASTPAEQSSIDRIRLMVRSLLTERFKLAVHNENRELPIYALVVNRPGRQLGPGLTQVNVDCAVQRAVTLCGGFAMISRNHYTGHAVTMPMIAGLLESGAGRNVIDRTELSGQFDVELAWAPDDPVADAPSLFTAVEDLGLKLEPTRGPIDVLVVDRAERPTAD